MYTSISTFRPALLCLLLLSGSAWAQTSAAQAGGFFADGSASTSASSAVTRVEDARQLPEDTYVTLEGYIIGSANSNDPEEYMFQDASGSIKVEISASKWRGQKVTPKTKIRIVGEVDHNILKNSTEIEVKQLDIISAP